jgi:hypothetical protein
MQRDRETAGSNGRPDNLLLGAPARGVAVVCGNVPALGGMIGCNDEELEKFLLDELATYDPPSPRAWHNTSAGLVFSRRQRNACRCIS